MNIKKSVIIYEDWPEYDFVKTMIESRLNGSSIEVTSEMSHAGHKYYQESKAMYGDFTPTGMFQEMYKASLSKGVKK